jgi:hypothetical protein
MELELVAPRPGPKVASYPNPATVCPLAAGAWNDQDSNLDTPALQAGVLPNEVRQGSSELCSDGALPVTQSFRCRLASSGKYRSITLGLSAASCPRLLGSRSCPASGTRRWR